MPNLKLLFVVCHQHENTGAVCLSLTNNCPVFPALELEPPMISCDVLSYQNCIPWSTTFCLSLAWYYTLLIFFPDRWGDCLVMVASQELREKALLGLECDPHITLTDIQYCLLEHVGQARYNGRVQKSIGSSFFKMDARSTFHHLKRLRKRHLVTMQVKF